MKIFALNVSWENCDSDVLFIKCAAYDWFSARGAHCL